MNNTTENVIFSDTSVSYANMNLLNKKLKNGHKPWRPGHYRQERSVLSSLHE